MTKELLNQMKDLLSQMQELVKEIERREELDHKTFYTWLGQYDSDVDISDEGALYDPEPYVPVAAASQEMIDKAIEEHREWEDRQNKSSTQVGNVE